jgi:hypothetical protein
VRTGTAIRTVAVDGGDAWFETGEGRMSIVRKLLTACLALALLSGVAACGDDDDDDVAVEGGVLRRLQLV